MTQATDTDIREIRDLLLGLDKKIDSVDKKLDVHIAKTEEQFKSLDIQISDLKRNTDTKLTDIKTKITDIRLQLRAQDNRLWTFVGALFVAVLGFLAKFAFFPGGQS
jgi:septal ring factor EnvC (AmiA/AmiB activator)